jgi:hypothetical protein
MHLYNTSYLVFVRIQNTIFKAFDSLLQTNYKLFAKNPTAKLTKALNYTSHIDWRKWSVHLPLPSLINWALTS